MSRLFSVFLFALLAMVSVISGCATAEWPKLVRVVDAESGRPIEGAKGYPQALGSSEESDSAGILKVRSEFPVIDRQGYYPRLVDFALSNQTSTEVKLTRSQLSSAKRSEIMRDLIERSFELNAERAGNPE